jgi:hypothetical protein
METCWHNQTHLNTVVHFVLRHFFELYREGSIQTRVVSLRALDPAEKQPQDFTHSAVVQ